jgi:hypothetical protein|tara:strand:+ start:117 stop:356 length:240 start_codon:yes stop_codon:yes gene_type:complete
LSTGEIISVSFPIYPVCNQFDRGHRIQLLISGSSFPRFDVNPNTGEPIGRQTAKRTAQITVHHSASHPSKIILPVMPIA